MVVLFCIEFCIKGNKVCRARTGLKWDRAEVGVE